MSASFNKFINFNGKLYAGVQIGRGHHWTYDPGDWKETKIMPDLWEISYAVTKRRVGHTPEDSVSPSVQNTIGILAHQTARKLNANDYATLVSCGRQRRSCELPLTPAILSVVSGERGMLFE
ncbi:MAG TPA: hypothetical protein VL727_04360 [Puia sp.]|nr:hypothetical protein [Puia sp.]